MLDLLQPAADRVHRITADKGKEFAEHEKIARELKADSFLRILTQPEKEGRMKP
jgi:IS30 family transposase